MNSTHLAFKQEESNGCRKSSPRRGSGQTRPKVNFELSNLHVKQFVCQKANTAYTLNTVFFSNTASFNKDIVIMFVRMLMVLLFKGFILFLKNPMRSSVRRDERLDSYIELRLCGSSANVLKKRLFLFTLINGDKYSVLAWQKVFLYNNRPFLLMK